MLGRMGVVATGEVAAKMRGGGSTRFKLAGIVVSRQERTSKQGNKFAFVQMSDAAGAFEVTVFSELLAQKREILEAGKAVLVEVDAQAATGQGGGNGGGEGGAPEIRFIARSFELLAAAAERAAQGISIHLYEPSSVPEIQKCLSTAAKGRGKVVLQLELDDGEEAELELPGGWQLTEALKSSLRQLGGGLEVGEY